MWSSCWVTLTLPCVSSCAWRCCPQSPDCLENIGLRSSPIYVHIAKAMSLHYFIPGVVISLFCIEVSHQDVDMSLRLTLQDGLQSVIELVLVFLVAVSSGCLTLYYIHNDFLLLCLERCHDGLRAIGFPSNECSRCCFGQHHIYSLGMWGSILLISWVQQHLPCSKSFVNRLCSLCFVGHRAML